MSLRRMMGKNEIDETRSTSSNYNKRAIPFSLDNEKHVQGLNAICDLFADPWSVANYKRSDLASDLSDFMIAVQNEQIVPIPRKLFDEAVVPFLRAQEQAQKDAQKSEEATDAKQSKKKK